MILKRTIKLLVIMTILSVLPAHAEELKFDGIYGRFGIGFKLLEATNGGSLRNEDTDFFQHASGRSALFFQWDPWV